MDELPPRSYLNPIFQHPMPITGLGMLWIFNKYLLSERALALVSAEVSLWRLWEEDGFTPLPGWRLGLEGVLDP